MKKTIFKVAVFACMLNITIANAQTEVSPAWSFMADATNTDGVTDFWVSPNGDSYILGHITTLPGNPHMDGLMFIKVNASGEEVWRKYLHAESTDWMLMAKGVAGDEAGNIYIVYNESYRYTDYTNSRVIIKKYNSTGDEIWTQDLTENVQGRLENVNARELLYKDGHLYLPGNYTANLFEDSDADGLVYKVSTADGAVAQKIIYNSNYGSDDFFRQVRADQAGNIFVIGRSRGLNGPGGIYSDYDSLIVKYDSQGNKLWDSALNGNGNAEDHGINIAIDGEGNSYTSSQVKQVGINQRLVVIRKHSPSGQVMWTYNFQGSSSGYNYKQPIEVLPDGNIAFVTSNQDGINTIVLNQSGTLLWSANYNRSNAGAANHQRDMMVDAQGNILITGVSRNNTPYGSGYDMVTISYSSTGAVNWLSNFNHGNYDTMGDDGVVIRQDGAGNIYAIGWTQDDAFNDDFLLLKYGEAEMGDEDQLFAEVKVYPNPATDNVFVSLPEGRLIDKVALHDINGRAVRTWNKPGAQAQFYIADVTAGLYLLTVTSGSSQASYKIIKK